MWSGVSGWVVDVECGFVDVAFGRVGGGGGRGNIDAVSISYVVTNRVMGCACIRPNSPVTVHNSMPHRKG
jgi:hypothetical protein